jgi:uncharacterized DUF497 family protein
MAVRFEWNESKNRANIVKHGFGFDEARRVFSDPHVIIREDRVVEGEQRLHAIGYVDRVLLVIHTVREEGPRCDYPDYFSPQSDAGGKEVV